MKNCVLLFIAIIMIACEKNSTIKYGITFKYHDSNVYCIIDNYSQWYDINEIDIGKDGFPFGKFYLKHVRTDNSKTVFRLENVRSVKTQFEECVYHYIIRKPGLIYEGYIYMNKTKEGFDVYTKEGNFVYRQLSLLF
mgnify:CR=1 FL=1